MTMQADMARRSREIMADVAAERKMTRGGAQLELGIQPDGSYVNGVESHAESSPHPIADPEVDPDDEPAALIPRDGVVEIVAHRDAAMAAYRKFFSGLEEAHEHLREAEKQVGQACGGSFSLPYVDRQIGEVQAFHDACIVPDAELLGPVARRLTDIQIWGHVVAVTDLEVLMDRTAKSELRDQMAYIAEKRDRTTGQIINGEEVARGIPEVTVDAIVATLEGFSEQSGNIWRRGVATAFCGIDKRFRSHDGFKVGSRMILTRAFDEWGSWSWERSHRDTLLDIERAFLVLDDRKPTSAYAGIIGVVEHDRGEHSQRGARQSYHEGEFFNVRVFRNGNAHIWFTRKDLVEKVNEVLAEYYGAGLGYGNGYEDVDVDEISSAAIERSTARNFGLFPTPDAVSERMIDKADLVFFERSTPVRVLEPSAGTGVLSSRLALFDASDHVSPINVDRVAPIVVDVVEIQSKLIDNLRASGLYDRVFHRDFLAMTARPVYDRVLMNPPFDRGRDIDHVLHAINFLAPGGELVAIMSASAEVSTAKKAEAFRKLVSSMRGHFWPLPDRSFAPATNVNTTILTLRRKS